MFNRSIFNRGYDLVNRTVFIAGIIGILACFGIIAADAKNTTCRLASQVIMQNQRICVYLGANGTNYTDYVPLDAGACPREYSCKYRPNQKTFNLKNVIKGIKKEFSL